MTLSSIAEQILLLNQEFLVNLEAQEDPEDPAYLDVPLELHSQSFSVSVLPC